MELTGTIYALSLDGQTFRYVGLTARPLETRIKQHFKDTRGGSTYPVHNWIRKHGTENVLVTVLSTETPADLNEAEQVWIKSLRNQGHDLLNLTDGGEGTRGWVPSEETRRRISEAMTGKVRGPRSLSAIEKTAATHRGMKRSAESRARMSAAAKARTPEQVTQYLERLNSAPRRVGWNHSEETKAKLSAAATGRPSSRKGTKVSEESRERMRIAAQKRAAARRASKEN